MQLFENRGIVVGRNHYRDVLIILGGGANQRRAADIDVRDQLRQRDALLGRDLLKRVEVHGDQVNERDVVVGERLHMVGIGANRQNAARHARMDGFQPAVEHFGKPRQVGHFAHRHASGFEHAGGAAGRDDLDAQVAQALGELHDAGFVGHADEGASDIGHALLTTFFTMVNVSHPVTLIPGDGIGPEVAEATIRAVNATGVSIDWQRADLNASIIAKSGQVLPPHVIESLERTRVGLKGPVTTPIGGGFPSVNVALRKHFDLYANVRPVHSLPGLKTRFDDVKIDMVIFRENTEHLYSGLEHEVVKDVVTSLKVITRTASIRIAEYAFDFARKTGRKRVAAIHKANIMKLADGLFLRCCREVAAKFPEIEYTELIVDNASMQLVIRPETFDILLLPNLYGDIVSDLAAGLVGGLGVVPGANMGDGYAVFEAVHGSAPDIAGRGIANPTALMLSAIMMLVHLGENGAAGRLKKAVEAVYAEGKHVTRDIGGSASTKQFTDAVIKALE